MKDATLIGLITISVFCIPAGHNKSIFHIDGTSIISFFAWILKVRGQKCIWGGCSLTLDYDIFNSNCCGRSYWIEEWAIAWVWHSHVFVNSFIARNKLVEVYFYQTFEVEDTSMALSCKGVSQLDRSIHIYCHQFMINIENTTWLHSFHCIESGWS